MKWILVLRVKVVATGICEDSRNKKGAFTKCSVAYQLVSELVVNVSKMVTYVGDNQKG